MPAKKATKSKKVAAPKAKATPKAKKLDVSLEELMEVGAHFGHQASRWNPKMRPYLYTVKEGVHVFDLALTRQALLEALNVIKDAKKAEKIILLVGTKKQAQDKVREIAEAAGIPFVSERWLGGTLTNFDQLLISTNRLADLKKTRAEGGFKHLTKRERLMKDQEIAKMEKKFGGLADLKKLPDLMIIVDIAREKGAATEAGKKEILTVGLADSNADPDLVDYPVPMNDDASKSINLFLDLVGQALK